VLASLSARRSRVRIPPGALEEEGWHGTQTGKATRLKPGDSVGSTPTRATERCVGWASASPTACKAAAFAVQVQLLPDALDGPFVYRHQDTGPSSREGGFDSHTGYCVAEWTGAWFPARSHKPSDAGSNPASATLMTAEYANRQSGQVESLVMSVGSTPTSAT
jgi:hypothetical protein